MHLHILFALGLNFASNVIIFLRWSTYLDIYKETLYLPSGFVFDIFLSLRSFVAMGSMPFIRIK